MWFLHVYCMHAFACILWVHICISACPAWNSYSSWPTWHLQLCDLYLNDLYMWHEHFLSPSRTNNKFILADRQTFIPIASSDIYSLARTNFDCMNWGEIWSVLWIRTCKTLCECQVLLPLGYVEFVNFNWFFVMYLVANQAWFLSVVNIWLIYWLLIITFIICQQP